MLDAWAGAIMAWVASFAFIKLSLKITEEYCEKKKAEDYILPVPTGSLVLDIFLTIIAFIIKATPWWFLRSIVLILGIWLIYVGLFAVLPFIFHHGNNPGINSGMNGPGVAYILFHTQFFCV